MKVGTEDKKKLIAAGVTGFFAIFACFFLYQELFGGPSPAPAPAPIVVVTSSTTKTAGPTKVVATPPGFAVGQGAAEKIGSTGGQLDPTLHMEAMHVTESLVYSGSGRNIFAGGAAEPAPVKLVTAKFPPRPVTPPAPPPVVNAGPPPPPAINLKFFGTATAANGLRRAFLINGDDVFLAAAGDIVQRRYRVVTISANSVLVEDIPNNNRQTLPLVAN